VTERLSVFFLLLALLLMQTVASLHRGSAPSAHTELRKIHHPGHQYGDLHIRQQVPADAVVIAQNHNLHDTLFGAIEGSIGCQLLDHLLEPPTATSQMPCVLPPVFQPQRLATAAPARISTFQLFGPPARGPPARLS